MFATGQTTLDNEFGVSIQQLIEDHGVRVTRDLAKHWLATYNTRNRNLRARKLGAYTRDMVADRWLADGAPIRFGRDEDGNVVLFDGQHRLEAIIRASYLREEKGLSGPDWHIKFLVVGDLDPEARLVIDTGTPKTVQDAALIANGVSYAKNVVPIGNRIYNWVKAQNPVPAGKNRLVPSELEFAEFYREHMADINQAAYWGGFHSGPRIRIPALAGGFAHYLIREAQADFWEDTGIDVASLFFNSVGTGAELVLRHPAKTLRETIISRRDRRELTTDQALALVLRAWNAFATEELISAINLPPGKSVTNSTLRLPVGPKRNWTGTIYNPTKH